MACGYCEVGASSGGDFSGSDETTCRVTATPTRTRSGRLESENAQPESPFATQATSSASKCPQSEGNARLAAAAEKPAPNESTACLWRTVLPYFSAKLVP